MNPEIEILVAGKPIRKYAHLGKTFIESRLDTEFTIKIKNNSSQRILAVPAVDGLSVLDGLEASEKSGGYVLNGYSSYEVKGFRVSDDQVNPFKFTDKKESFAAKNKDSNENTSNCGVIGVRIYAEATSNYHDWIDIWRKKYDEDIRPWERPNPWYPCPRPWKYPYDENPWTYPSYPYPITWCSAISKSTDASIENYSSSESVPQEIFHHGVGYNPKAVEDKVKSVEFDRAHLIDFVEIFFSSRPALEKLGVKFNKEAAVSFPKSFKDGYCKIPQD